MKYSSRLLSFNVARISDALDSEALLLAVTNKCTAFQRGFPNASPGQLTKCEHEIATFNTHQQA